MKNLIEFSKVKDDEKFYGEDEFDLVYTFKDLERLSTLPFDECWCYKNPIYAGGN